jgi:hypothetical protein
MKSHILLACATLTLAACTTPPSSIRPSASGYAFKTASDGKLYRIDGATGETWLVSGDKMHKVNQTNATLLEVGRKYFIERNRAMIYLGDSKFTDPVPDFSALWN